MSAEAEPDDGPSRAGDGLRQLSTKALDLGVYLPVGLLLAARQELPRLTERGRQTVEQQMMVARFIGTIAAQQGRREIERRLSSIGRRPAAPTGTTGRSTGPAPTTAATSTSTAAATATDPSLAISDYTSLSATQIIALLVDLDHDELDEIEEFERSTRNRRTVLNRIESIRRRSDGLTG